MNICFFCIAITNGSGVSSGSRYGPCLVLEMKEHRRRKKKKEEKVHPLLNESTVNAGPADRPRTTMYSV